MLKAVVLLLLTCSLAYGQTNPRITSEAQHPLRHQATRINGLDSYIYDSSGWIDEGVYVHTYTATDNVGIGTIAPRYKLEVDGDVYMGSVGGNTIIESDGSLYAYGAATWYDDLPITLNPATAVNAPTYTSWKGGRVITLSDESVNDDQVPFITQFPHAYRFGSTFDFHVHIVGEDTTACNYRICVDYSLADINKPFPANGTGCLNVANLGTQDAHNYIHVVDVVPDTAIYGNFISTAVVGKFYRNSSNSLDTCNAKNLYFIAADLHLERNTLGSRQEIVK